MVRKAQISIFIVLGLVLLISTSIFFYFKTKTAVFNPEKITELHSTPITSYVDACVRYSAEKAIRKLGRQGGYLYFPPNIAYDPLSYISMTGLDKLPFWYYQGQSRIPSLEKMESDLADYVEKDAYKCIDEFKAFSDRYNIDILDNLSVSCRITPKTVQFDTSYPVDVVKKSNNQKIELRDYKTVLNVRLKDAWEMSKRFVEQDLRHGYLANMTMLLAMVDPKIPIDGLEFRIGRKQWSLQDIKEELYELVNLAFATKVRFRFNDPVHPFSMSKQKYEELYKLDPGEALQGKYRNVPKDFYDYKHFYFPIFDNKHYEGLISSAYPAVNKYFLLTASPNKNGYLYSYSQDFSQSIQVPINLFVQFWHFLYNIYYPVIFSVKDPKAFNNNGFIFKIAYPISVENNRPAQDKFISFSKFKFKQTKDLCDLSDGYSREIRIETRNLQNINPFSMEPEPIRDVEIYYQCPQSTCYYGNTTFSRGTFGLDMKLPKECINGVIVAKKPGYITKRVQAVTSEQNFVIDMVPLHQFKLDVTALTDYHASDSDNDGVKELEEYNVSRYRHNVTVALKFSSYDYNYETAVQYRFFSDKSYYVNLSAGKYKVEAYVLLDDADKTYVGGYSGNLTIDSHDNDPYELSDLDKSTLGIKVFVQVPIPKTDNDIYEVQEKLKNSDYIKQLIPELS